jgi:hypothetical protein
LRRATDEHDEDQWERNPQFARQAGKHGTSIPILR